MKKVYKMENLQCVHCTEKMQSGIMKIEGVDRVSINFMLQKITLEGDDIPSVLPQVQKKISDIERDCKIIV